MGWESEALGTWIRSWGRSPYEWNLCPIKETPGRPRGSLAPSAMWGYEKSETKKSHHLTILALDPRPLASRAGEIDFYCLLATWSIVFLMVAWMDSDDIFVKTQARVPVGWVGINEWKILDSITSKSPLPADPDPLIIEASLITLTLSSLRLLRLIYKIYVSS